ncbi:MAG TPA: TRAP transporter small permease [Hyphomicrobiaceae bacterium]|nr:TRAP transporter small permease [Hyphomicrobiaceae bacterium]
MASILSWLAWLHDRITVLGARIAALLVGAITLLYCVEVVDRYFLHAPSSWTAAVAIYLMLGTVLLMMPYLAMGDDHVSIAVAEYLPQRPAYLLSLVALGASIVVCGLSAFISFQETLRAFERGVRTTDTLFIPKWWLLAPIVYGLGSATLHFARRLAGRLRSSGKATTAASGTEASVG